MKNFLAAFLIVTLTGCAALPISGPVRIGPDLAPPSDVNTFYYSPSPPVDGATATEILSGFISAGTAPQNDYSIAREYLSESIRASWYPNQELLIQKSTPEITLTENGTAFIEIDLSARVDANGRYEALPSGSTRTLEYSFIEEAGQIRILSAPDVTIVIRPVFDVVFRSYSVFFLDQSKSALVPELRWFPANPATGTKLVNALLAGPSDWLKPAVVSAIPIGTTLSLDAVTVQQEVALVDLSAGALVASLSDRILMKAQLNATLSQLPIISRVAVSIERSAQDIPDAQPGIAVVSSGALIALGPEGLRALSGPNQDSILSALSFFESREVSEIAVSSSASRLAAATSTGVFETGFTSPAARVDLVDPRTTLVALSYDQQNYLWAISRSQITVNSQPVRASWITGQSIVDFALSPEGSRMALIVDRGDSNQVLVSAVIRNQAGIPVELAAPITVAAEVANPTLVSWLDGITIAVLNSQPSVSNVSLVAIGGVTRVIQGMSDAKSLVALGDGSGLYLLKNTGELFVLRGSFWSSIGVNISAITLLK